MDKFTVPTTIDTMHTWLKSNWSRWSEYEGLYPVSQLPSSCPWQFDPTLEIDQIIELIFQPIKSNLPQTVQTIRERCQSIFALLYQDKWYLLYVVKIVLRDDSFSFKILGGGQPTTSPQLRKEVIELGWTVPNELRLFYQVHNGLGDFSLPWQIAVWDTVLPDWQLRVLGEHSDKEAVTEYDPNDLLEFFPDGGGNGQYFYRAGDSMGDLWTVDWDHETTEISKPERFWDFVDRELSKVDEVRYNSNGQLKE